MEIIRIEIKMRIGTARLNTLSTNLGTRNQNNTPSRSDVTHKKAVVKRSLLAVLTKSVISHF
jgi:hypothetical protein